ncbi:MAG: [FeFe] hydrogenase, group A [Bacteroidetes bacterium]|nr:[FeFe] hydrogenase, group A [Bacteroidota bacterium]
MTTISLKVNHKDITARKGETILSALERNGLHVPTLCHMKGFLPSGACRLCIVEDEKSGRMIPSCSYPVEEGMEIQTNSPKVIDARKTIVELLLSNHPDDCLFCERNGNCELQTLSKDLHVTERRIKGVKNSFNLDRSSASIVRDPDKCVLCGRCVRVCEDIMGVAAIDLQFRGSKSLIGVAFGKGLNTSSCINCGQCIMVCPTGALTEKNHFPELLEALNNTQKEVVVQYAPAISVSMAEEFGMRPGKDINGILNAALRKIGFDKVFDTSFSADLTIMEEASELVERLQHGGSIPMFTSCCPAWTKYMEEFEPEMLGHLSTCKSPQQMLGAIIKSHYAEMTGIQPQDIYSVSIMPCTAKKFEAQREEMTHKGITDVDAVLTTRELVKLIKMYGIDLSKLQPEMADSPMGMRSSAGKLFAASGGVMEAAIRTAHYMITGKEMVRFQVNEIRGLKGRKEARISVGGIELGVAVVSGLANAKVLLQEIKEGRKDIHFIEVMSCPGGCIAGGGQLISNNCHDVQSRLKTLYEIDEKESIKVSHRNPEIRELYDKFLGKPLGHKSHELLHTTYKKREVLL